MSNVFSWKNLLKDTLLVTAGVLSAGMGLKGFLLSSHFIDGGVTGISMLISSLFNIPLAILIPIINIPFIFIGYRQISLIFAIKSCIAIAGLAICLSLMHYPDVTPDPLLTAIFGGFFIGAGIGLAMRGGAVLDGTEIAAVLITRRISWLRVGDVILLFNIVIFTAAAYFLGVNVALYSILTYFAAAKTIDFIVHGLEEYTAVIIVSEKHEEIHQMITEKLKRGVTVLNSEKGYGKRGSTKKQNVLYSVVTRLEVSRLRDEIAHIDPQAFIVQHGVDDTRGGIVKQRALH
ncbi:YitT family protein [Runella sp. MFBS21]|uniref:YitT family protein n=1 Tax=Runella sp. MFBS21 TaxID=3034018 RepID=UPI0023F97943|nr:YitT family protein [Runella sp. MFBS21]MDF7819269.1 YitT family protein [Runella sp. MFBS21]